jgi:hypothetical protein
VRNDPPLAHQQGSDFGVAETTTPKGVMKMKYRKKPVVVEAFRFDGDLKNSNGEWHVPAWAVKAFEDGIIFYGIEDPCELYIKTLEGVHHVSVDDYIIQGVKGELYPCKPDIFKKTYEKV